MHTNLDAAYGGVNDCLAKKLGLNDVFLLNDEKIGRIGTLSCEKGLEAVSYTHLDVYKRQTSISTIS